MLRPISLLIGLSFLLHAELTPDQKASDFRSVVDKLTKFYAPLEWKKAALKRDPFAVTEWVERARKTTSDITYYELVTEYVASLEDGHAYYAVPASFRARLGFTVDLYDGKVLIDSIDRRLVSESAFPGKIGDEILKIDGQTAADWILAASRVVGEGNREAQRRVAASMMTSRPQAYWPRAVDLGDAAEVEMLLDGGAQGTFRVPWIKSGYPLRSLPGIPTVSSAGEPARHSEEEDPTVELSARRERARRGEWKSRNEDWALGVGTLDMPFARGESFQMRIGDSAGDRFRSGIFTNDGRKIAYVRIPRFDFSSIYTALARELAALDGLTEGLILDVTRNPGGFACGAQALAARVTGDPFKVFRAQYRVANEDLYAAWGYLDYARNFGNEREIAEAEMLYNEYEAVLKEGRFVTRPLPLCGSSETAEPYRDPATGALGGYTKPVVLLVDEFSASASESLGSMLQDNGRALVVGKRTAGAGGAVYDVDYGVLSEGSGGVTWALGVRPVEIDTRGEYPVGPYVENIGIRPDRVLERMTVENLKGFGAAYREALLAIAAEFIASRQ